ncbi:Dynamin-3 [Thelohanellus kitauei]|uniref:Dynamin-3 n=1 Tax=Thelohanellus kitauei TaxID=669202 RepID=A0A0C2MT17_THEKT|nr:Dynamin-3 [Thelohanellus kitauei]
MKFSPYPKLKSLMCSYLNEKLITFYNESKDFIKLLVKIQVDHINTNHPDFLAAQDPYQADDLYHHQKCYIPGSDSLIFREGTLLLTNINTLKSNKEYYCTLKGQTLYVYKDSFKKDMKEHFVLNDCKIKDLSHRNKFQLLITPKNERSLHKSSRSLELGSSTGAELEGWKAALVSCGIELDRSDEMKKELFSDLVISVFKIPDIEDYMQESEELKSERQRICAMNKSCEEALEIIHTFQRGHRGNITKHRTLLPPKPKSMIDPSEPIRRGSDINISKLSHTLPLKSISDLNLNTSSISKSSSFQKNKTPPPTEIKKPKRPPPKMVASKFYDINPNNT